VYDDITSRPLTTPHHSVLDLLPRIHTPFPRQRDRKENRFATLSPSLSPRKTVNHRYRPPSGPPGHPANLTSRPLDHLADFTSTHLDQIAASLRPPQTDVKRRLGRASDHRAFRSTVGRQDSRQHQLEIFFQSASGYRLRVARGESVARKECFRYHYRNGKSRTGCCAL
jgi:hypothetical protein